MVQINPPPIFSELSYCLIVNAGVHLWFSPIIEHVIEGAAVIKRHEGSRPFPCCPVISGTMNSDANAISWGRDAPLRRYRRNSVPACTEQARQLNSAESLRKISKDPLIPSFLH